MGRLLIRAPNHLGEVIMALPALRHASAGTRSSTGLAPLVQVVSGLVPVLEMAGLDVEILALYNRHALPAAARAIRDAGGTDGILLTPSISSAVILKLAGLSSRRGTAARGRTWLLTDPVDRRPLLKGHRVHEFLALVGCEDPPREPPPPRLLRTGEARQAWALLGERSIVPCCDRRVSPGRTVGLFPGGNADSRRWPMERFWANGASGDGRCLPGLRRRGDQRHGTDAPGGRARPAYHCA